MNAPALKPIRIEEEFVEVGKHIYIGDIYIGCVRRYKGAVKWQPYSKNGTEVFTHMKFSSYENDEHIKLIIKSKYMSFFSIDKYGHFYNNLGLAMFSVSDGLWLNSDEFLLLSFSWFRHFEEEAVEVKYDMSQGHHGLAAFRTYYGCLDSHLPLRLMVKQHHQAADIMRGWDCQVHGMGSYFMKWCFIDGNTWIWRMVEPRPAFIGENINLDNSFTVDDNIKNLWDLSQSDAETGKQVWKGIRKEYL